MRRPPPSREELFALLDAVMDPEVPVLSVVELGIIRDVSATESAVTVTITPTYSGCPAMHEIESGIRQVIEGAGLGPVVIKTVYAPAWTTDWIGPEAREKLEAYGIAPPGERDGAELVPLLRRRAGIRCPHCQSMDTEQRSVFGSTACKSIWVCTDCLQPFEAFKAI